MSWIPFACALLVVVFLLRVVFFTTPRRRARKQLQRAIRITDVSASNGHPGGRKRKWRKRGAIRIPSGNGHKGDW